MKLTDSGGGGFEDPEVGSYAATGLKIIDLGTRESDYQGQKRQRRELILGWELDEKMSDGRPFVVSEFYTASLSEKATLRKVLAGWRGRDFTPEELQGFNPRVILGKSCILSLAKNDKGKIKVSSVGKLPKGMVGPTLVNPIVYFSLDEFDRATFDSLSEGVKKLIVQSPEYKLATSPAPAVDLPPGHPAGGTPPFDDVEF